MTAIEPATDLTAAHRDLQDRARRFVEDVLIPREEMAERAGGVLPPAEVDVIRRGAMEARLHGGVHASEHGGRGRSAVGGGLGKCTGRGAAYTPVWRHQSR